jgi:hypothetical protein
MDFQCERMYLSGCNTQKEPFFLSQRVNERLESLIDSFEYQEFAHSLSEAAKWTFMEKSINNIISLFYYPLVGNYSLIHLHIFN